MAKTTKTPAPAPKQQPKSVFATATKIAAKNNSKPERELVPVPGLARFAAVVAVEKLVKAIKETYRDPIKAVANSRWVAEIIKKEVRPENFRAVDAVVDGGNLVTDEGKQASIEMRKRGTNSPLKDEERTALEADGVPYSWAPMKEGQSQFGLNPKYESDPRLEEWGVKMAELGIPEDFIVQMLKPVVDEETLRATFKRKDKESEQQFTDRLGRLIPIVTVLGVKPVTDQDPVDALTQLAHELSGDKEIMKEGAHRDLKEKLRASARGA